MSGSEAYEAVPYDDRPVAETHPDHLWVAGRRVGVPAAAPATARILELGCAHGVNLVPIAYHLPDATVLGVDLSPGQIERGRARVAELELPNLELRVGDVTALDLGDTQWDYIVAHGLLSWVPAPVQTAILQLCARHLAPSGIAYLSYNAMPAWGVRGAIGRALRILVGSETDDVRRLHAARAGLAVLATVEPLAGTAEGALLAQEIADLADKPDAYLLHEYLVPHARAFYLEELVAMAEGAGLSWIGDVAPSGLEPAAEREARSRLRDAVTDPMAAEQLLDVMGFRQFRASLLVRADAPRVAPWSAADLVEARLARPSSAAASAAQGSANDAALVAAVAAVAPADLGVADLAVALGVSTTEASTRAFAAVQAGVVEVRARALDPATEVGLRPAVHALSRFEARHLTFVTTPMHECAPLDAFHAALVRACDGTRDHAAIVEALVDDVRQGRLSVARGATPTATQLRTALPPLVAAGLERLCAAGLFVAPR